VALGAATIDTDLPEVEQDPVIELALVDVAADLGLVSGELLASSTKR